MSHTTLLVRAPLRSTIILPFLLTLAAFPAAHAITIRHDVPDSDYLNLGADLKYATSGLVNGGTACAVAGGTLINPEWVLTAAHCVPANMHGQTVKFNLGPGQSSLELTVEADNWFRHSSYNGNVADGNDLALIHLDTPILSVTPIRLYRGTAEQTSIVTVIGYGKTGTGLTGDTLPRGTRRGADNVVDRIGSAVGLSSDTALTDFDNPDNAGDSVWGSAVPLPLEGAVAFSDSGSPWYLDEVGLTYLAAVSSFRSATDGNPNSDYGDISGGMRVGQDLVWIDTNHDRTVFWDGSTGNWNQDASWVASPQPVANNTAVIDVGDVTLTDAGELAKFIFLDGTGRLDLGNTVATNHILVRGQSALAVSGSQSVTADVTMAAGTMEFDIRGTTVGREFDQLTVSGTAAVNGALSILVNDGGGSYTEPATRGTVDTFVLLAATDLVGNFASVDYDGQALVEGSNYIGANQNLDDGLFRLLEHDSADAETVTLKNYLALPGDANGDLTVDFIDLNIWSANRFQTGTTWLEGDFNGDGTTDFIDLNIWSENRFTSAEVSFPEPGSGLLLLTGAAFLASRRPSRVQGGTSGNSRSCDHCPVA